MAYWLIKTEPSTWSWEDQVKAQVEPWNGVRNYQASNNLQAMKKGDLCFFYHSGADKEIVGIVEVVKEYYPDPTDEAGRFGMVDVKTVEALPAPVSLKKIKEAPSLSHIALVRHSRLSVMPIDLAAWKEICRMGGL